jgi:hypothetical protein
MNKNLVLSQVFNIKGVSEELKYPPIYQHEATNCYEIWTLIHPSNALCDVFSACNMEISAEFVQMTAALAANIKGFFSALILAQPQVG